MQFLLALLIVASILTGWTVPPLVVRGETLTSVSLTDEQRNSIAMLNHLTVLTKEIGASTNSRLYLEEVFSSLVNNTYPNAVDGQTLFHLRDILDLLEEYRMVKEKRERLAYDYEQSRAQTLRSALPDPLGLMSAVRSYSLSSLIPSIVYMAVDSVSSYSSAETEADMAYLKDGWSLDDKEAETLHYLRSQAFVYMVEMVNTYNLPGDLALNEESVANLVNWKNEGNTIRRIQLLQENRNTYEAYGPYWLLLSDSYFRAEQYAECLSAIDKYEEISTRIFRKDYELAKVLPSAIIAAEHVYTDEAYVAAADRYVRILIDNTAIDDWAQRYFAAQTFINLYDLTGDKTYLREAYDLALNNVTHLIGEQKRLNAEYLADVKKAEASKDATDAEKKEIENYNRLLQEKRKTALPPISNAFLLNCELLFSLSEEIDLSETDKARVDSILHHEAERAFLCPGLDDLYWFVNAHDAEPVQDEFISFSKERLTLPASLVISGSDICVTVRDDDGDHVYADFTVTKVERKAANDVRQFVATFESPTLKRHPMKTGAEIKIMITPNGSTCVLPVQFSYMAQEQKVWFVTTGMTYVRVPE